MGKKGSKGWNRNSTLIIPEEPQELIQPEEKEVKEMDNRDNGHAQPQVPWKDQLRKLEPHCPTCLGDHAKVLGTIVEGLCTECGQTFIDETGTALAEGKLITKRDWMTSRLTVLEQKLEYAKAAYASVQTECVSEAADFITKTIGSAQIEPEVRKKAFQDKKSRLWLEKNGNTKFAIMKGLEGRVLQLQIAIDKTQTPPPQSTEKLKPVDALAEAEAVLNTTP